MVVARAGDFSFSAVIQVIQFDFIHVLIIPGNRCNEQLQLSINAWCIYSSHVSLYGMFQKIGRELGTECCGSDFL